VTEESLASPTAHISSAVGLAAPKEGPSAQSPAISRILIRSKGQRPSLQGPGQKALLQTIEPCRESASSLTDPRTAPTLQEALRMSLRYSACYLPELKERAH